MDRPASSPDDHDRRADARWARDRRAFRTCLVVVLLLGAFAVGEATAPTESARPGPDDGGVPVGATADPMADGPHAEAPDGGRPGAGEAGLGARGERDGAGEGGDARRPLDEAVPVEAALAEAPPVVATLAEAAEAEGLEPELLLALAWHESRFDPEAVSAAGAVGVLQVMPGTFGAKADALDLGGDPRDPEQNAAAAAAYLAGLVDERGGLEEALVAYNQGPVALDRDGPYPVAERFAGDVLETRDRLRGADW